MRIRSFLFLVLLALGVIAAGCAGPDLSEESTGTLTIDPVRVKSEHLAARLIKIGSLGSEGTLVEDSGWLEYIIEIENISVDSFTIKNVKLLNQEGRYLDSATTYEQITAPPDIGVEVAGDVAETVAGIAVGQIIPYGGTIFSVLSSAASASSGGARANVKQVFLSRVLKNVELAPTGKMEGSAFLPNIQRPKTLVMDYTQNGAEMYRIEIPLPIQQP